MTASKELPLTVIYRQVGLDGAGQWGQNCSIGSTTPTGLSGVTWNGQSVMPPSSGGGLLFWAPNKCLSSAILSSMTAVFF